MFAVDNSRDLSRQFTKHLEQLSMNKHSYCLVIDKVYKIISEEPHQLVIQSKGSSKTVTIDKNRSDWAYLPDSLNGYCRSLFD